MLKHIVMWKFIDENKNENMERVESALKSLVNQISQIKFLEVGLNISSAKVASDMCLVTHFNNEKDLEAYRVHPEHVKVAELIAQVTSDRTVVDYTG